jgi:hypothetical protein
VEVLAAIASQEARILADAGFDAVIIENMHDAPYIHGDRLGPEVVSAMTRVGLEVRHEIDLPIGVQILSGGNRHAIAVAQSVGGGFVRCENFVFAHVADEGLLGEAEAGPLLRYRREIGASGIRVLCDIKKKHASHAITSDISLDQEGGPLVQRAGPGAVRRVGAGGPRTQVNGPGRREESPPGPIRAAPSG